MKRIVTLAVMGLATLLIGAAGADAATQTWRFSITGSDMMNVVYEDGPTSASRPMFLNPPIYDGARLYRGEDVDPGTTRAENSVRSFVEGDYDQNGAFESWFTTTENRLGYFNLWGADGRGEGWGEVYNSTDQQPVASPAGWTSSVGSWPANWGTPPDSTSTWVKFQADDYSDAIAFGDGSETNWGKQFTFDITLDESDWNWYGANLYETDSTGSPWYQGVPGQMVFWFGGYELSSDNEWGAIYEGNAVLQGQLVPAPAAVFAGLGLLGVLGLRRKRA